MEAGRFSSFLFDGCPFCGNQTVLRGFLVMPLWIRAAGIGGSILVVIALVIALLKSLIALVGFITTAIKIVIILVFVAVFLGVALMVFRTWKDSRKTKD
jgi:hypothetical protein